jgi:negative regulator of replication initiation
MRFHQVEVDDDIFQFVKTHAEPLVDTFNSTLRRLLLASDRQLSNIELQTKNAISPSKALIPSTFKHLPQALQHILEVVRLVRDGSYSRTAATQYVARQYDVFPQTILDKYCRQLGLTASQFDRFLAEPELTELKKLLKAKYSDLFSEICEYLK